MKTILITGCSRGLGRAAAEKFLSLGHRVIGCARNADLMAELARAHPAPNVFAAVDVSQDAEIGTFVREAVAIAGVPDLVLNNAALINRNAPLWDISAKEFDALLAVNLSGTANVIRHVLPHMMKKSRGVLVNFSSGWGRSTSPEVAPYCRTKWGVEGLTQALAQELPAGLAAVALNPGIIDTDMLRVSFGGSASHYPDATDWAERAVPFLLQLGARDNGKALTVPG
ncbi:MAG: SDR family oxidoreductase [Verrucomicrobiales bacterium]